jgi:hypothetical protein
MTPWIWRYPIASGTHSVGGWGRLEIGLAWWESCCLIEVVVEEESANVDVKGIWLIQDTSRTFIPACESKEQKNQTVVRSLQSGSHVAKRGQSIGNGGERIMSHQRGIGYSHDDGLAWHC